MGGHKLLYLIHTAGIVLIPSIYPAVARDVEYIYVYIYSAFLHLYYQKGKHSQAIQSLQLEV